MYGLVSDRLTRHRLPFNFRSCRGERPTLACPHGSSFAPHRLILKGLPGNRLPVIRHCGLVCRLNLHGRPCVGRARCHTGSTLCLIRRHWVKILLFPAARAYGFRLRRLIMLGLPGNCLRRLITLGLSGNRLLPAALRLGVLHWAALRLAAWHLTALRLAALWLNRLAPGGLIALGLRIQRRPLGRRARRGSRNRLPVILCPRKNRLRRHGLLLVSLRRHGLWLISLRRYGLRLVCLWRHCLRLISLRRLPIILCPGKNRHGRLHARLRRIDRPRGIRLLPWLKGRRSDVSLGGLGLPTVLHPLGRGRALRGIRLCACGRLLGLPIAAHPYGIRRGRGRLPGLRLLQRLQFRLRMKEGRSVRPPAVGVCRSYRGGGACRGGN